MISNFLKVAFRVFMRNRTQTLLNIFGLAIGISFSIVIFLYANKELSFDRFHKNAGRIYKIAIDGRIAGNNMNLAITPNPLGKTIQSDISEVENVVRVARFGAWLIRHDSARYNEDNIIFTDPAFFTMFSFPLVKGSPEEALSKPNSIVISEASARRYFSDADPMGKKLRIENDSTYYTVTGVMKNVPDNSQMQFDMVGTLSTFDKMLSDDRWVINYLYTYIELKRNKDYTAVTKGLNRIIDKYVVPDLMKMLNISERQTFNKSNYYHYHLQALPDIHLNSTYTVEFGRTGKLGYVYLFIIMAFIILVLSCMNFVGLVTARSFNRTREVSIRKISGSERGNLIRQFLLESSLLAFLGLTLGLFLTELSLPLFSRYIGLHLSLGQLLNSAGFLFLFILIISISIFSGIYPALYLSSFSPSDVLRNVFRNHHEKGNFRKYLAGFQLFLAIGAIIMTLIVMSQYKFLIHRDRGYETRNLVVIRRPDALTNRLEDFKREIMKQPEVLAVANASSAMGSGFPRFAYFLENTPAAENYSMPTLLVSHGFDSTYRINMTAGRFFSVSVEDSLSCVINETAARELGLTYPVGKTLVQLTDKPKKQNKYKIIGVTSDFYYETLENPIRPLCILLMPGNFEGYLTVRIRPENQDSTIQYLKKVWESYTNAYPFVYYMLDNDRKEYYKPVLTTARIFKLLSLVNIIMACLSLFALMSFSYYYKGRQISIQKAMGASDAMISMHRAGEIIKLVVTASAFAWIGVLFLAHDWLSDYAYHIHINPAFFIIGTFGVLLLALLTVCYHTCLVTRTNPAPVLKYE